MPNIPKQDDITYLVSRRLRPQSLSEMLHRSSGAGIESLSGGPLTAAGAALAYEKELRALPQEQIAELVRAERAVQAEEQRQMLAREEAARFYNQPSANMDLNYWFQQAYWRADEMVALSFGKDPRVVNWENLKSKVNIWKLAKDYADRRETIGRAITFDQLYSSTMPHFFLAWARRMRFEVPPELYAEAESRGIQVADWNTVADQRQTQLSQAQDLIGKLQEELNAAQRASVLAVDQPKPRELGSREHETLLKIIIVMAIAGYKYDPLGKRNSAVPEVVSDAAQLGLSIGADTVREKFKEAAELLPGNFE